MSAIAHRPTATPSRPRTDSVRLIRRRLDGLGVLTPIIHASLASCDFGQEGEVAHRAHDLLARFEDCMNQILDDLSEVADAGQRSRLARIVAPIFARCPDEEAVRIAILEAYQAELPDPSEAEDSDLGGLMQTALKRSESLVKMWTPLAPLFAKPESTHVLFFGGWKEQRVMQHLQQVLKESVDQALRLLLRDLPPVEDSDLPVIELSTLSTLANLYAAILEQSAEEQIRDVARLQNRPREEQRTFIEVQHAGTLPPLFARADRLFRPIIADLYLNQRPEDPAAVAG